MAPFFCRYTIAVISGGGRQLLTGATNCLIYSRTASTSLAGSGQPSQHRKPEAVDEKANSTPHRSEPKRYATKRRPFIVPLARPDAGIFDNSPHGDHVAHKRNIAALVEEPDANCKNDPRT